MERKLKILAVDDDAINLMLIKSMLKKCPDVCEVVEAKNGLEAINKITETEDIDLILLDIKMPIMNGMEFMDNVSTIPNKREIPIIVLTTDESMKYKSFDGGAFDFLVKPIRKNELYEKIEKVKNLL
jgi:putative two-component system response regulator